MELLAARAQRYESDVDEQENTEEVFVSLGQEECVPVQPYQGPVRPANDNSLCKYKDCKRTDKASDDVPARCSSSRCANLVHTACSTRMLQTFGDASRDLGRICGKRCFNAVVKRAQAVPVTAPVKKRVNWDDDGPTPDVSSLSCVLDWMTTGSNFSRRWRGGKGQVGESKTVLASEIIRVMAEKGIQTVRRPQDVITKISNIVTSFNTAADWLRGTGVGVTDEDSLRACVLQRCAYYYTLVGYIDDSHSTNPVGLNTDPRFLVSDSDGSDGDDNEEEDETAEHERAQSTPLSIVPTRRGRVREPDPTVAYIELKESQFQRERDLKRQKLVYRAQEMDMQREDLALKHALSEAQAKEANARTAKVLLEAKVTLLRERRQLALEGIPQQEIDQLLPLTSQFEHVRE